MQTTDKGAHDPISQNNWE